MYIGTTGTPECIHMLNKVFLFLIKNKEKIGSICLDECIGKLMEGLKTLRASCGEILISHPKWCFTLRETRFHLSTRLDNTFIQRNPALKSGPHPMPPTFKIVCVCVGGGGAIDIPVGSGGYCLDCDIPVRMLRPTSLYYCGRIFLYISA